MRLRWVMRRLREWAAWIDSEGQIKSPALDGMPVAAANAEAWIPKDYRLAREVHAALRKLSPDDRVTIVLVYVAGPRHKQPVEGYFLISCFKFKKLIFFSFDLLYDSMLERETDLP